MPEISLAPPVLDKAQLGDGANLGFVAAFLRVLIILWRLFAVAAIAGVACAANSDPAIRIGERLFSESRFAHFFFLHAEENLNAPLAVGDPALASLSASSAATLDAGRNVIGQAMSCRACHFFDEKSERGLSLFGDQLGRSAIPERGDGRRQTPRNSPPLVGALATSEHTSPLHFDAEFATPEELVIETYLGRNFGWLPSERSNAIKHFARVVREDNGATHKMDGRPFSYAQLLRGADPAIPAGWRLPDTFTFDPANATDDEILRGCARLVVAFLRSLQFSRDEDGQHNGSAYDAFLAANLMPRAPRSGESPREYARRLGELLAALRVPRYVEEPGRGPVSRGRAFRFGAEEFRGLRIFFREGVGTNQSSGAGNCVECHVPPDFTDFKFHNTGVAQDDFDSVHGGGAFAALEIPDLAVRERVPDRWLPPSPAHPHARGVFFAIPTVAQPSAADLGVWNIYANPDFPAPQPAIERLLNPGGQRSPQEILASTIGRFKTSHLRGLPRTAPYFHTGHARSLEDTVQLYRRMSELARGGQMRNAPHEFYAVRLGEDDIAPLVAFLRGLDEDYRAMPSTAGKPPRAKVATSEVGADQTTVRAGLD